MQLITEDALFGGATLEDMFESLREDPAHGPAHQAVFRFLQHDHHRLINFYRALVASDPEHPEHVLNLARVYAHCGMYAAAIVQFKKSLRRQPRADGYSELARCYLKLSMDQLARHASLQASQLTA